MDSKLINQHKNINNRFFARWAKLYDLEKYVMFPLRQKAAKFLQLNTQAKVLDIATGTGAQAYELAKRGYDVVGVDLSKEMLEQAKKKLSFHLKLRFLQTDATKLPFGNNSFDASSISFGLHDMPHEIELLVLKEMKRVTMKNGKILIIDYMEPRKHWMAKIFHPFISLYETSHYVPFIKRGLGKILSEVSLNSEKETHFLGLAQIVLVRNKK